MSEFFGFGGYQRTPEGYLSWQHLLFVSSLMLLMIASAVFLGLRNKNRDEKAKNLPLIVAAIAIDSFEIFKIVMLCFRNENPMDWVRNLPLFLCSIQLISIPLAAFTKGKLREVCLDFIFVFGLLGAVAGTYGAGQNYGAYPVLSLDNVVSGITHSISGCCSLYIAITGLTGLEWKNLPYCCGIMAAFCVLAYIADILIPYNYMFLMRGDGTPYDIFYNMVNGNQVLYPIIVVLLFFLYIGVFYGVYHLAKKPFAKKE
ncbi:MAG: YwaF family protein, partial [Bacilli bacterium]|nr:YwaF family protein [Bacilli bacterium]